MRLANLAGRAALVVGEDAAIDVHDASNGRFGPSTLEVLDDWGRFAAEAQEYTAGVAQPFRPEDLGAPVPLPRQVFAIGLNYASHAQESGMEVPTSPATFTKFPSCVTGPRAEVRLPCHTVDWEVELVVVIGHRADAIAARDAWWHVAGLTIGQDLSDRTLQFAAGNQFSLGKSHRGFAPTGPWIVTTDELVDPDDLGLGCSVDGVERQNARTSDLVVGVSGLVEYLSSVTTLLPGDLIFTGTPAGVGMGMSPPRYLRPGEVVESWIEGIGTMTTTMVGPP
jgi:2-keto-4-pentenoate hydratase/2-oxohepta-3-ene-1,7-dioic acid hydratase in catechol pathway